jgi:integrase
MGRPSKLIIRLRGGWSGEVKLKHLSQQKDRYGKVRTYFRKGNKRTRMKAEIGTEAFMEEYRALCVGNKPLGKEKKPLPRNSLRWLVEQYYESAEFKVQLSERTQYVRRRVLEAICLKDGEKPFALMEPRHIRKLRDEKSEVPGTANTWVKTLRQLFTWAQEAHGLKRNPAKDVPYIHMSGEGFHQWTAKEVQKFENKFPVGTMARLAFDLLLFTGVRRSDVVRLGPPMEVNGGVAIKFVVTKGQRRMKKELVLPILSKLRQSIDATAAGKEAYLVTQYRRPFSVAGFGNWFRDRCNEAGLTNCSAHGLRKAGATIAAENGATAHQLKAIFGWESISEAEHYTKRASQAKLAESAMHLLERNSNTDD